MPSFGKRSLKARVTMDPRLQGIVDEAIKKYDFSIIWGHRDMGSQNQAYKDGHTNKRWPNSKHNTYPSIAMDIVPYPGLYNAPLIEFYKLATIIYEEAMKQNVRLRWGGHWKKPFDPAHYELRD